MEQIVSSKLLPGEMLPSIRVLAKELGISVITVKKAYDDLEAEGFIATRPGKGSCVATAGAEFIREMKLKTMQQFFEQGIAVCRELEMDQVAITEAFHFILNES
ncbi:MAG: GntR family transcriptional regulator [Gorillibacterium sp.]|nr:GntR family transcriptional regulator [Gorillibacterium sp.]